MKLYESIKLLKIQSFSKFSLIFNIIEDCLYIIVESRNSYSKNFTLIDLKHKYSSIFLRLILIN